MQRFLLKSKIHRATVTEANLDYEESLLSDEEQRGFKPQIVQVDARNRALKAAPPV